MRDGPVVAVRGSMTSMYSSKKVDDNDIFRVDGIHETEFVLAVQEANFLYSFTLSAFTAMITSLIMINEDIQGYSGLKLLNAITVIYFFVGLVITVKLYGRKNMKKVRQNNLENSINYIM